jgi:hypothetical protein
MGVKKKSVHVMSVIIIYRTFHTTPFLADGVPVVTKEVKYSLMASNKALSFASALEGGVKNACKSSPWKDPKWGLS